MTLLAALQTAILYVLIQSQEAESAKPDDVALLADTIGVSTQRAMLLGQRSRSTA